MAETKPNSGSLWKNNRRDKDTHPHATGSALIECPHCSCQTAYFADAWTNEIQSGEKKGEKYQSLKFKVKDKQQTAHTATAKPAAKPAAQDMADEDVPF